MLGYNFPMRRYSMQKVDYRQLELNPFTVIGEESFLLTAGRPDSWNTMTAGWGGFGYLWQQPVVFVFVRESRYTFSFLRDCPSFTLSFFSPEYREALEYCGSHSGKDGDKAGKAGVTPVDIDGFVAFEEANMIITCTRLASVKLDGTVIDESLSDLYPQGDWHHMFIGRVEGVYIN